MAAFTDNARTILEQRYYATIGNRKEDEESFLKRISFDRQDYREGLFDQLDFLPNSPTLFNLRLDTGGTLSACFRFTVEDTLLDGPDSIMNTAVKAAAVTKDGGGVGYYLGNLRPKGALVHSTHGAAMGPVAVLKHYNSLGTMLTQSGKRDAAQMGILPAWHPDILEFITVKNENPQALATFNISVSLTDEFMYKAVTDKDSNEAYILYKMAESAWRTGDPGVYFVDAAERFNPTPWAGKLDGTNPCGEVPLLNNEPCNLGSINLGNMVVAGEINWGRLERVTRLATRYLDDVLDHNNFPVPQVTDAALYTRKLGLGVCGWADFLALMGVHYMSEEALTLEDIILHSIRLWADDESYKMAYEKGPAPCYEYTGTMKRNATTLCIAPTGTIAILMGASSGIEPHFMLEWQREMANGTILNEQVPVLDRLPSGFTPQVSHDITPEWHVKHQAVAQRHVDLAVSKTVNMKNHATVEDILNTYIFMWQSGCKGGTIFRDGSRSEQVLRGLAGVPESGTSDDVVGSSGTGTNPDTCPNCSGPVVHAEGCSECLACDWSACSV